MLKFQRILAFLTVACFAFSVQAQPTKVVIAPPDAQPGGKVVFTPEAAAQLSAADRQRAAALKSEANKFFVAGRYKEAIERFGRSYDITRDANLMYSIAVSYQNLERWKACVSHMERYLETAPVGPKRDRAENTRISCDARIARDQQLIVSSTPPGARIFIDDRSKGVVGQTANDKSFTTFLRPGQHTVWLELDGFEPVEQTIEVQAKEPFRMSVTLTKVENLGWLYVDCTVRDARVYIAGKTVGLTPFEKPLPYGEGPLQIVVERDGYTRFSKEIAVRKGQISTVDAYLVSLETPNTWRTPTGWTFNTIGALAIGAGVGAWLYSNTLYNDTDDFERYALYEKISYGVGGGLLLVGTSLVIWDKARDVVPEGDRNPNYGKPVKIPKERSTLGFGIVPGGFTIGGTF